MLGLNIEEWSLNWTAGSVPLLVGSGSLKSFSGGCNWSSGLSAVSGLRLSADWLASGSDSLRACGEVVVGLLLIVVELLTLHGDVLSEILVSVHTRGEAELAKSSSGGVSLVIREYLLGGRAVGGVSSELLNLEGLHGGSEQKGGGEFHFSK